MKMDMQQMIERLFAGQEEMRCIIGAVEEKMDAWIANMRNDRKRNDGLPRYNVGQSKENVTKSGRKGGHSGAT
jgi:hypothetical protein